MEIESLNCFSETFQDIKLNLFEKNTPSIIFFFLKNILCFSSYICYFGLLFLERLQMVDLKLRLTFLTFSQNSTNMCVKEKERRKRKGEKDFLK